MCFTWYINMIHLSNHYACCSCCTVSRGMLCFSCSFTCSIVKNPVVIGLHTLFYQSIWAWCPPFHLCAQSCIIHPPSTSLMNQPSHHLPRLVLLSIPSLLSTHSKPYYQAHMSPICYGPSAPLSCPSICLCMPLIHGLAQRKTRICRKSCHCLGQWPSLLMELCGIGFCPVACLDRIS